MGTFILLGMHLDVWLIRVTLVVVQGADLGFSEIWILGLWEVGGLFRAWSDSNGNNAVVLEASSSSKYPNKTDLETSTGPLS